MKKIFIYLAILPFLSCIPARNDDKLTPNKKYEFDDLTFNETVILTSDKAINNTSGSNGSFYSIFNRENTSNYNSLTNFRLADLNITSSGANMVLKSGNVNSNDIFFLPSNVSFNVITANEIQFFETNLWNTSAKISAIGNNFIFKTKDGKFKGIIEIKTIENVESRTINIQTQNVSVRIKTVKN